MTALMDLIGVMDRVIVHSTCAVALIALLVLAQAFTGCNYLKNRVPVVVSSISLLLCCVGVAYLIRGHSITGSSELSVGDRVLVGGCG